MSTEARRKPRSKDAPGVSAARLADLPGTITIRQLADTLGVSVDAIKDWVGRGEFPEPHSIFGRTWLYRLDYVRAFLETGRWPAGVRFKRPATRQGEET
jgi:excisionase family DNA binding protein